MTYYFNMDKRSLSRNFYKHVLFARKYSTYELRVDTDCLYYNKGHRVFNGLKNGIFGPWKKLYSRVYREYNRP